MRLHDVLRRPSGFLPLLLSLAALMIILLRIAFVGTAPQSDEGTAARLWQLLMVLQVPVIAYFALRWMPRDPRGALPLLGLQVVMALAAMAPVFLLGW